MYLNYMHFPYTFFTMHCSPYKWGVGSGEWGEVAKCGRRNMTFLQLKAGFRNPFSTQENVTCPICGNQQDKNQPFFQPVFLLKKIEFQLIQDLKFGISDKSIYTFQKERKKRPRFKKQAVTGLTENQRELLVKSWFYHSQPHSLLLLRSNFIYSVLYKKQLKRSNFSISST